MSRGLRKILVRALRSSSGLGFGLLPSPLGCLRDQSLFQGVGGDANIADFPVDQGFYPLEIGHEPALGDGCHVRADAALFLGFAAAPDVTALDGPRAG